MYSAADSCHCSTEYVKVSETLKNYISSFHLSLCLCCHGQGSEKKIGIWDKQHQKNSTFIHSLYVFHLSTFSLLAPDTHTQTQHHSRNRFACAAWLHLESLNQILDHSWWVSQRSMSERKPVDEHHALGLLNPSGAQIQFETAGQKASCGLLLHWPCSLK